MYLQQAWDVHLYVCRICTSMRLSDNVFRYLNRHIITLNCDLLSHQNSFHVTYRYEVMTDLIRAQWGPASSVMRTKANYETLRFPPAGTLRLPLTCEER